jgi:hypothetical protein
MKIKKVLSAVSLLAICAVTLVVYGAHSYAASIGGETFSGISTTANQWTSGGASPACLTAATTSATNSIPACSGGPYNTVGNGVLRLTPAVNNKSGFAIYNTPITTGDGLKVSFDMYQYGTTTSSGADGIAFFLIDGSQSPTQPGAVGGSLGYSSNGVNPGIVGGYVGVGFDWFGNFSGSGYGSGGIGRVPNSVTLRGSESTGYQYITSKVAAGSISNEAAASRANAKRHVVVTINSNNIMTVQVDYNDGSGLHDELQNINLNEVNGNSSLPTSFKFGFAASTGGSNNIHEISGFTVDPIDPKFVVHSGLTGPWKQDEDGSYTLDISNAPDAGPTIGTITYSSTLPSGFVPKSASGTGWTCTVAGQQVNCTHPGTGADAIQPNQAIPTIQVYFHTNKDADTGTNYTFTHSYATPGHGSTISGTLTSHVLGLTAAGDHDTVSDTVEDAAPNNGDANQDGTADKTQVNVTSFSNSVTGQYSVVDTSGCTGNRDVSAANVTSIDNGYTYPAGLVNFKLDCAVGATATVNLYYYGLTTDKLVLRKYDANTGTYSTIPNATFVKVHIGGQDATKITYAITDGGSLDEDGTVNGVIIDPAGPALQSVGITAPNTGVRPESPLPVLALEIISLGIVGFEVSLHRRQRQS